MFLSYSALRLYGLEEAKSLDDKVKSGCPHAYYLRYIKKVKPDFMDCRKYYAGAVCHNCMERWIKETGAGETIVQFAEEEIEKYLASNFVCFKSEDDKEELRAKIKSNCEKIQKGFIESELYRHKILSEFEAKVWDKRLNSFLYSRSDIVCLDEGFLLDLKVTTSTKYFDTIQGIFNALTIMMKTKKKVTKFGQFVPLRKENIIWSEFTEDDIRLLYGVVSKVVEKIRNKEFTANPESQKCYWCDYSSVCNFKDKFNIDAVLEDGIKIAKL